MRWYSAIAPTVRLNASFNYFFTTVGIKASESATAFLTKYNLPTIDLPEPAQIPVSDQFHFHPVSCSVYSRSSCPFPQIRHRD